MKIYLILVFGVFFSIYSNGQNVVAVNGLDYSSKIVSKQQLNLIFEETKTFPNNTELSIAIIKNGKISFYGVKRSNDIIRFSDNSKKVFEIGSISKVFTSTLLSNFVIDKKINLNASINDYLKIPIKSKDTITFLELANHTSGLPRLPSNLNLMTVDPKNPYKNYDEKKLKEYLTDKLEIKQTPSSKYEYSNFGVGLLGYILSKQSNSSYNELLQKYIFSKYKMNSSTTIRENVKNQIVIGLDKDGNETSNWDMNVFVGTGGILSNTEDLSKFTIAEFDDNNKELELTRQPTFTVNENMSVGLGWHIIKTESNDKLVWHNGGTGGYSSSMAMDIDKKNGIIILSNVSGFNKDMGNIDDLCFGLMETLKE